METASWWEDHPWQRSLDSLIVREVGQEHWSARQIQKATCSADQIWHWLVQNQHVPRYKAACSRFNGSKAIRVLQTSECRSKRVPKDQDWPSRPAENQVGLWKISDRRPRKAVQVWNAYRWMEQVDEVCLLCSVYSRNQVQSQYDGPAKLRVNLGQVAHIKRCKNYSTINQGVDADPAIVAS